MEPVHCSRPFVSIVIETVTARSDRTTGAPADDVAATIACLDAQTYPHVRTERILVVDDEIAQRDLAVIAARYPSVKIARSAASNYFEAKNAGAAAAQGEIVAFLDGDCEPVPEWLDALVAPFETRLADDAGVAGVAGRTRYIGEGWPAKLLSLPDFAYVAAGAGGAASGFNANNVAFRRDVILSHRFDGRIPRNGGCIVVFHQLKAAGHVMHYAPRAAVGHGMYDRRLGFAAKYFERGREGVLIYRLDRRRLFRGTRYFERFGMLALIGLTCRRVLIDWRFIVGRRRQLGVHAAAVPLVCALALALRLITLAGGLSAVFSRSGRNEAPLGEAAPYASAAILVAAE